tara:strand:- start:5758 stop:5862 length:105 start_codon:yes stop_codon:yes gene_type:complete
MKKSLGRLREKIRRVRRLPLLFLLLLRRRRTSLA